MTSDVETMSPAASLYDIVQRFLGRSYLRLPVVDDHGRVIGRLSRREALRAIESVRDNSYLYGSRGKDSFEGGSVDSAIWMARAQSKADGYHGHRRRLLAVFSGRRSASI